MFEIRKKFYRYIDGIVSIDLFSYIAVLNGYKYGYEWFGKLLKYLFMNRDFVENSIHNIDKLKIDHIEATRFMSTKMTLFLLN